MSISVSALLNRIHVEQPPLKTFTEMNSSAVKYLGQVCHFFLITWTSLVSPPDFHSVPLRQNEAATAKEFIKIMEAAENDYQVCVGLGMGIV